MIPYDDSIDPTDPTKKKALINVGVAGMPQIPLGQTQPTDPTLNASDSPDSKATDPSVATTPQTPMVPHISTSQLLGITDAGGQTGSPVTPPITPQVPAENPISMNGDAGGPYDPSVMGGAGGPPTALRPPSPGLAGGPGGPTIDTSKLGPPSDINGMTVPTGQPGGPSLLKPVGAAASTFGPGNDLRYSVIDPGASARTEATGQQVDQSASQVAQFDPNAAITDYTKQFNGQLATPDVASQSVDTNVGAGPAVDPVTGQRLSTFQQQQDAAAAAIANGPNRQTIAQQNLDAFDKQAQPQLRDQLRAVGQRASALGRIGNGQTAIEALTPYTDYLNNRSALETKLAADTAAGDIQDRQNNLSAASGLVGQTAAQDAATRGEQRTERSNTQDIAAQNIARAMAERDAQTSNAQTNAARTAAAKATSLGHAVSATDLTGATKRATTGTLASLEGQQFGQDQTNAANTRGERSYQQQISDKAIQDAINQHLLEQSDQSQGFNQNLSLLNAASANNPDMALLGASNQAAGTSAQAGQSLDDLIRQYYANQKRAA